MSNDEKDILDEVTRRVYGSPPSMNNIEVIRCGTWRDFQDEVKLTPKPFLNRVFRGQSEADWNLKSKWDRYQEQKDKAGNMRAARCRNDTPDTFLEEFKKNYIGNAQFDTSTLKDEDWMALGRHHGLITPLLDWTESPYVAAYFAFKKYLPIDKELGCLNPTPIECESGYVAIWEIPLNSALKNFPEFKVVHSRTDFSNRQKAQSSLFTLLDTESNITLDVYLKTRGYQHIIRKYLIPKKEVLIVMHDLHLMNINESAMFPDAEGAASQANLGNYFDWLSLLEQTRRDQP